MRLAVFNPLNRVGPPALLAALVGVVSLVGGRWLWPLAVVPGVILCVLGVRIAYDSRLAAGVARVRDATPWHARQSLTFDRQIWGGVVSLFGLFLLTLAATGVARLVS